MRAFGRVLDLLVRAIRMNTPHVEQAAQRALGAWRGLRTLPFEIETVEARMQGVSLAGPEHELRWVLPAFMAGLRKVSPHAELSEMELRNFAEALAHLDPNVQSIEAFREWIWAGAATGFELELQSSFMEALDDAAMEREVETTEALDAMRAAALRSLASQAELLSTRTLNRLADRDELDLPLCTPETRADDPESRLEADLAEDLRVACEDRAGWIVAEVRLITTQGALADTVRVDRFARRLHDALKGDPGGCFGAVESLAQRARHGDAFALDMLQRLDDASFGEDLAPALWRDPAHARRDLEVALALGSAASSAALAPLLERAGAEPGWSQTLRALVESAGGRLDAPLLERPGVPAAGEVTALVGAFGARALDALWTRALGGGEAWLGRPFATLCRAVLDAGQGEARLVPVARDRGLNAALRIEVIDVLGAAPELLAQATAWRMGELLEPPAVRERLKALRGRA